MSTITDTTLLSDAMEHLAGGEKEALAALLTKVEIHTQIENQDRLSFSLFAIGRERIPCIRDLKTRLSLHVSSLLK